MVLPYHRWGYAADITLAKPPENTGTPIRFGALTRVCFVLHTESKWSRRWALVEAFGGNCLTASGAIAQEGVAVCGIIAASRGTKLEAALYTWVPSTLSQWRGGRHRPNPHNLRVKEGKAALIRLPIFVLNN